MFSDGPFRVRKRPDRRVRALRRSGRAAFPSKPGEFGAWMCIIAGPQPIDTVLDAYRYVVFNDANWDWRKFNLSTDIGVGVRKDAGIINDERSESQTASSSGRGKLLMYHGWADQQVAARNSVDYFSKVARIAGNTAIGESIELYMVPGMGHCAGGPGTDTFAQDGSHRTVGRVKGRAPESIIAAHRTDGAVDRHARCARTESVARWKGTGSTDDAANVLRAWRARHESGDALDWPHDPRPSIRPRLRHGSSGMPTPTRRAGL